MKDIEATDRIALKIEMKRAVWAAAYAAAWLLESERRRKGEGRYAGLSHQEAFDRSAREAALDADDCTFAFASLPAEYDGWARL